MESLNLYGTSVSDQSIDVFLKLPVYEKGILKEAVYDGNTFLNPHDVCVDNDKNLYIPQWYSGRTYPVKLERV